MDRLSEWRLQSSDCVRLNVRSGTFKIRGTKANFVGIKEKISQQLGLGILWGELGFSLYNLLKTNKH